MQNCCYSGTGALCNSSDTCQRRCALRLDAGVILIDLCSRFGTQTTLGTRHVNRKVKENSISAKLSANCTYWHSSENVAVLGQLDVRAIHVVMTRTVPREGNCFSNNMKSIFCKIYRASHCRHHGTACWQFPASDFNCLCNK